VLTAPFAASHRRFLECAQACHDLRPGRAGQDEAWIGDPMEQALARMATGALGQAVVFERIDEIPFDPER
jgi:magnesium-transporting ATPase (P-type)